MVTLLGERTLRRAPGRVVRLGALLAGFAAALAVRVGVGGVGVAQSASAGLVFALTLAALSLADRRWAGSWTRAASRTGPGRGAVPAGLVGSALICGPAAVSHLTSGTVGGHPLTGFPQWVAVVAVVACAEELFLRGTLFGAAEDLAGAGPAVGLCAVVFALLHVPLYGWHVLPLDTAVGVVLGGLRVWSRTWVAPAVAHVTADVAGWFLR